MIVVSLNKVPLNRVIELAEQQAINGEPMCHNWPVGTERAISFERAYAAQKQQLSKHGEAA